MYLCIRMKESHLNIGRVALAIALIMLLTLLPHHHHVGGAVCYVAEVCHQDGRVNDSHTHHHDKTTHCYWHKVNIVKTFAQSNVHFCHLIFGKVECTYYSLFRATYYFKWVCNYVCLHV